MNELAPIIFNEVKEAQKELSALGSHVVNMSFPTEYPWEVFISSRSWVVPADGEYFIICIGGGGGSGTSGGPRGASPFKGCGMGGTSGGYTPSTGGFSNGTGGGGGGGLSIAHRSLSKGNSLAVTVGAPGISAWSTTNANGSAGGRSSVVGVGVDISCEGGGGSLGTNSTSGATSTGLAAGGDINMRGQGGGSGNTLGGGGGGGGFGADGWGVSAIGQSGGHGGQGGGGGGGGRESGPSGQSGQLLQWLSAIPGYIGHGSTNGGFVAIRRVR